MGVCASADEETMESKNMEKEIAKKKEDDERKVKLLLLGAGESGKSTIFKQMKILYGDNSLSQEDMNLLRSIIFNNIITTMQTICEYCETFELMDQLKATEEFKKIVDMDENDELTDEHGQIIATLWDDAGIKATWARRGDFQIVESMKYYFKNILRIASDTYMNKDEYSAKEQYDYQQDALYARVRTSGIVTEAYNIDGHKFEMYDVGGQRNERRKWIHCFENVTAVIFVAAISEYNQKLFEDATTNRMLEALEIFEEVNANKFFFNASMILFLNKRDLFMEKIKKTPINAVEKFSDYTGGENFEAGCKYFEDKFVEKHREKCGADAMLYKHVTCATDTENIKIVMDAAKQTILEKNFGEAGLLYRLRRRHVFGLNAAAASHGVAVR